MTAPDGSGGRVDRADLPMRWWVLTDEGILGHDARGEVIATLTVEGRPRIAACGDTLAVLTEGTLSLRDGQSGELRVAVSAPNAVDVLTDGVGFWLDERTHARALDLDGGSRVGVDLGGGVGLAAVGPRHAVTHLHGPHDIVRLRVVGLDGRAVLETGDLRSPVAAAVCSDALVVSTTDGTSQLPFTGGTPTSVRREPDPPVLGMALWFVGPWGSGRYELWRDVVARDERPVGRPEGPFQKVDVTEVDRWRIFGVEDEGHEVQAVLDDSVSWVVTAGGLLHVLVSAPTQRFWERRGPSRCLVLGADLVPIREVPLGDRASSRLAVCAGRHPTGEVGSAALPDLRRGRR